MGCRGESAAEARAGEQEVTFAFWIVVVVFVGVVGFFFFFFESIYLYSRTRREICIRRMRKKQIIHGVSFIPRYP